MSTRKGVLVAVVVLLGSASTAIAQQWGRERAPRDGACFYKDPNYRGDYFCVAAGDELNRVPNDMNDQISSMKVFGRVEAIVYRDIRFDGRSSRFDSDIRNLKEEGWDDLISSIRVRSTGRGFGSRPGGSGGSSGRPSEDPDRVIRRAYEDVLQREPDATGLRLYRSRIIDQGWNEAQVRESLRDSQEYRERSSMTPAKAQEIVRRAYLAILRREPDAGSRGFVDKVLRDHWSQQDVERELRKSPEYRNKG
jgi:hypothetical protein